MDSRWYLDVNRFARDTSWGHSFMHGFALWAGVVVLGALLVAGWWRSRREGPDRSAAAIWAVLGTLLAVAINQPVSHLVGRPRPFAVFHHVETLVPRAHDFGFPSDHATVAGAVICGLFLARQRGMAIVATVVGLFLSFARVYVGVHYPGDVAAGLVLGAVVVAVLFPAAMKVLRPAARLVARSPLWFAVTTESRSRAGGPEAQHDRTTNTPLSSAPHS